MLLYMASAAGVPMFSMCFISFCFLYLVWEERFYKGLEWRGPNHTHPYATSITTEWLDMVGGSLQNGDSMFFIAFHCLYFGNA